MIVLIIDDVTGRIGEIPIGEKSDTTHDDVMLNRGRTPLINMIKEN